jgi:hypothetical protein
MTNHEENMAGHSNQLRVQLPEVSTFLRLQITQLERLPASLSEVDYFAHWSLAAARIDTVDCLLGEFDPVSQALTQTRAAMRRHAAARFPDSAYLQAQNAA